MANNLNADQAQAEIDGLSHFDVIINQIQETFNQLIAYFLERKEILLLKVFQLREDFVSKEFARREAVQELERNLQQLRAMRVKANLNIPIHQQASLVYEEGMNHMMTPTKLPILNFTCPTHDRLVDLIGTFGDVSEGITQNESNPKTSLGGGGKREYFGARGVALDDANLIIYIADTGNSLIQRFSFEGELMSIFGEDILKRPWGITIADDFIFITDISLHSLIRYDRKTLKPIDRVGTKGFGREMLDGPRGLAVDTNGDVYVADSFNSRISIFSILLQFISSIGQRKLLCPLDVNLTSDSVLVLDWYDHCIHLFTRNGELLSSCSPFGSEQETVSFCPLFFCLDKRSNIIICDYCSSDIKIVSRTGEVIRTINCQIQGKDESILPYGIAISQAGTVYMVSTSYPFITIEAFQISNSN